MAASLMISPGPAYPMDTPVYLSSPMRSYWKHEPSRIERFAAGRTLRSAEPKAAHRQK